MAAILALVLIAIVVVAVVGFALHMLFTPWLLVPAAILVWLRFRPHRSHQ
jgi:hypothetical protein